MLSDTGHWFRKSGLALKNLEPSIIVIECLARLHFLYYGLDDAFNYDDLLGLGQVSKSKIRGDWVFRDEWIRKALRNIQ